MFRELYMRTSYLLLGLLSLSLMAFAQQSPSGQAASNNNPGETNGPITVEGCVTSINGYFLLMTHNGQFRLEGDHDSLFGHDGQQVRIVGIVTKKAPQTLKINELKKIADSCEN
jgi:hypothetical protein